MVYIAVLSVSHITFEVYLIYFKCAVRISPPMMQSSAMNHGIYMLGPNMYTSIVHHDAVFAREDSLVFLFFFSGEALQRHSYLADWD